jgi:hypothetical protein
MMAALLGWLERAGLLVATPYDGVVSGWRLNASVVRIMAGLAAHGEPGSGNHYFQTLYRRLAAELQAGSNSLWGLEGREHTAQVSREQREWREARFRYEDGDQRDLTRDAEAMRRMGERRGFLPALFCSPTMELGGRYLGAERGLSAQRAADAGQLRSARQAGRALRPPDAEPLTLGGHTLRPRPRTGGAACPAPRAAVALLAAPADGEAVRTGYRIRRAMTRLSDPKLAATATIGALIEERIELSYQRGLQTALAAARKK